MKRDALLTLPNSISLSRLILALAFVLMDGRWERTILIVAAGLTDILDGWVARIAHSSSVAGALIDPFADRVFVLTAVTVYLISGVLNTVQYFIFLARDIMTAIGFVVARFIPELGPSAFKARTLGKTVTVFQISTLVIVLHFPRATPYLIAVIGGLSAVSIVDYTLALSRERERVRARQASR